MRERGMIKWKPFNTLLKTSDITLLSKEKELIKKPIIMNDRIEEIDNTIKNAIKFNKAVEVKYFEMGLLKYKLGYIKRVDKIEKYIQVDNTRMYFKNVINIKIIEDSY